LSIAHKRHVLAVNVTAKKAMRPDVNSSGFKGLQMPATIEWE
jgi:hypothetical protein